MPQPFRISPSMPSSPNSLTITAMRRPCALSRMWRSSVVLPLPRKPVTMVAGIFCMGSFSGWGMSEGAQCGQHFAREQGHGVQGLGVVPQAVGVEDTAQVADARARAQRRDLGMAGSGGAVDELLAQHAFGV